VTRLRTGYKSNDSSNPEISRAFFFSEMSAVSLRVTHSHCVGTGRGGIFSLGIKRPGLFVLIHLLWNLRIRGAVHPTHSFPFMVRRFIKHNYNVTFCQLCIISNTVVTLRTMYFVLEHCILAKNPVSCDSHNSQKALFCTTLTDYSL
jgi:hypothetical protein